MAVLALPTADSLAQQPIPQEDAERKRKMAQAWKAYKGDFLDPLKVEEGQPNDNVKPNRCGPIVKKGASWLFGSTLKIECDEQDFVDGLWGDDDDKMTLLTKAAVNGGCFGQVFLKLVPAAGEMQFPRIVNLNPQVVRIVTLEDDVDIHVAYIIEYPGGADVQKKQIIARIDPDGQVGSAGEDALDDTWTITNYQRQAKNGIAPDNEPWLQVGPVEEWPYPFAPILTCQNLPNPNDCWGEEDLTPDLIEMNNALNFNQSNTQRIIKYHGHPLTYAIGMRAAEFEMSVDGVVCLPDVNSKLEKLAAMDNFTGLLSVAASLRDDMDEQSRVPAVALGRLESLPKGNISGVALQLLFQPLIEKTTQKQRLYGKLIREVTRAALIVAGKIDVSQYEDYEVSVHWQNLLPVDDLAAAQTALLLKQLGVSDQTILQELGYDPDAEADKSAEEDQKKMVAYSRGQGMPPAPPQPGAPMPGQPPASPFMGRQGGQE